MKVLTILARFGLEQYPTAEEKIESIGSALSKYDVIHLATSAFNTLYTAYFERFTIPLLTAAAGRAVCLGHIDCYNEAVRGRSFISQHWIRTCFFLLTGADIGQGVAWHSRIALAAEALPGFEQKALCILNEQMLGIRLRALGCRLVDVTWA